MVELVELVVSARAKVFHFAAITALFSKPTVISWRALSNVPSGASPEWLMSLAGILAFTRLASGDHQHPHHEALLAAL